MSNPNETLDAAGTSGPGYWTTLQTQRDRSLRALGVSVISGTIGALGDGSTDDRGALNTASGVTGTKVVPTGTYRVASALTLTGEWHFHHGAKLKPDSGITITIQGHLAAGWYQIFDLSAGGSVVFTAGTGRAVVFPEWWGALADGTTDDSTAFNSAYAAGSGFTQYMRYTVMHRSATYRLTHPVSAVKDGISIDGERAVISATTATWAGTSSDSVFTVGSDAVQVHAFSWEHVSILWTSGTGTTAAKLLKLHNTTFWEIGLTGYCKFGGAGVVDHGIHIGDNNTTEGIVGDHVETGGCNIGIYSDGDAATGSPPNVLKIGAGKHQQHNQWAFWLRTITTVELAGHDLSLNGGTLSTGGCGYVENCGNVTLRNEYHESNGTGVAGNGCRLWYFKNCGGVHCITCLFNATNGSVGTMTHLKYGVYAEDCRSLRFSTCRWKGAWDAQIYVTGSKTRRIVIDEDCEDLGWSSAYAPGGPKIKIDSSVPASAVRDRTSLYRLTKPAAADTVTNYCPAPCDLSQWTLAGSVLPTRALQAVPAPDGRGMADTLYFPSTSSTPRAESNTPTIAGTSGISSTHRLRFRARVTAEASPRTKGTKEFTVTVFRSDNVAANLLTSYRVDLSTEWTWVDLIFVNTDSDNQGTYTTGAYAVPAADIGYRIRLSNSASMDEVTVAIDGVHVGGVSSVYFIDPQATAALVGRGIYGEIAPAPVTEIFDGKVARRFTWNGEPGATSMPLPRGETTFRVGDYTVNDTPTAGGVSGYRCVTAGAPGTAVWKSYGAISA